MKRHWIRILIGCGLPLLLIFFTPLLGLNSNVTVFIVILFLFACHLLIPIHHGNHKQEDPENSRYRNNGSSRSLIPNEDELHRR